MYSFPLCLSIFFRSCPSLLPLLSPDMIYVRSCRDRDRAAAVIIEATVSLPAWPHVCLVYSRAAACCYSCSPQFFIQRAKVEFLLYSHRIDFEQQ